MSLIEEALRRQQEEAGKPAAPPASAAKLTVQAPPAGPPAPVPPPLPETVPDAPAGPSRQRPVWLIVVLLLGLVVSAGAAVAVFAYRYWQDTQVRLTQSVLESVVSRLPLRGRVNPFRGHTASGIATGAVAIGTGGAPSAGTGTAVAAVSSTGILDAAVLLTPEPVAVVHTAAVASVVVAAATQAPPPAVVSPAAVVFPPAVAPPRSVRVPVVWPSLHLSGVLEARGANRGAAIINNRIIGEQETIEGVTVVRVRKGGVALEYKGDQRFLKIHGTTD